MRLLTDSNFTLSGWLTGMLLLVLTTPLPAADINTPVISIIIDDMGYRLEEGRRALALPGAVTYSFLPYTPNGAHLAETAAALGKEVLLHMPMEAQQHNRLLGPGALRSNMSQTQFVTTLRTALESMPRAIGINNHMGSLLTTEPEKMQWLMAEVHLHEGLFFVDSRTTTETVAAEIALEHHIPTVSRDVFLDDDLNPAAIRVQFQRLIAMAHEQGYALAIAHPHPQSLALLAKELPHLEKLHGVRLVGLGSLVNLEKRHPTWQLSLSHSLKAVKN